MSRKIICYAILICALLFLPFLIYQAKDIYSQNPLDANLYFENPSFIAAGPSNDFYVIDQSMKRLVKINDAGDVDFFLKGGSRKPGGFFYASELAVDPAGYFYVLNRVLDADGAFVEKEEVLRYSPGGKYNRVVFSKDYPEGERPLREGWISSIACDKDDVYFYYKEQNHVTMLKVPLSGGPVETRKIFSLENARVLLVDVKGSEKDDRFVYTTKKGEIISIDQGHTSLLYSAGDVNDPGGITIPWKIALDKHGYVYFTDLGERKICKINSADGEVGELISPGSMKAAGIAGDTNAFYQFALNADGNLFTINDGRVIVRSNTGAIDYCAQSARYPVSFIVYRTLTWLLPLVWTAVLFMLLRFIYVDAFKRNIPKMAIQIIFILFAVVLSAGIVSDMLFKSFFSRYEQKVLENLAQTAQLAPAIMDGDVIQRINKLEHFMNEDYDAVKNQLFKVFNDNQDSWNQGQYGAVYKVKDNRVYALMFYDDSIGTYYPVAFDYKNSKYFPVYDRGEVITVKESDADGDWIYALGPIYNSRGEIVAMVEVGTDLFGFVEENKNLVKNMILDIATILVVLFFVLTELTVLGSLLSRDRRGTRETGHGPMAGWDGNRNIVRPLGFIMFTGTFMSVSFIPVLMKELYQPLLGLPESIVLGLPISAEMLFVAIFSVLAGYMIDARGWKPAFLIGMVVLGAGTLLSGLTHNQLVFILARAIVGSGFGLAIIALQTFAMAAPGEEEKNQGIASLTSGVFSGMNVGVVVGGMLAERAGFSNVFFVAIGMVALAFLFAHQFIPNVHVSSEEAREEKVSLARVGNFFCNVNVMAFFLLIFIPVSICGMFLMYFFPLFAEEAGISSANVGRAFMLNGLCIIYLGPLLSKYISRFLGAIKSVVIYTVLVAGAMLLFANQGSVLAAFIAIIILGIADSFGIALLINYFSGLRATTQLGQGKAMGYYSLVEYLGQMLGPIALGSVMLLGVQRGVGLVGLSLCAALVLFLFLSRREEAEQAGKNDSMTA